MKSDDEPSPFAGLDYPEGCRPSTGELGPLAESIRGLYGVTGPQALAAAVLLDQGRAEAALQLLDGYLEDRRLLAEDRRDRRAARQGGDS